ncbi:MAG: nucleoside recognition protein [Bacteroidales bacterium]|jgi:spore maturation protein SpmB|nr:nucleoside recognition protein [Bacteroidales bacterium]
MDVSTTQKINCFSIRRRFIDAARTGIRPAGRMMWWMAKLTVVVSASIAVLQYAGVITWLAEKLHPLFGVIGLPGESALIYLTAYFVNLYPAVAALVTLDLDLRAVSIMAVMCLCSHNMIIETAIQKKCGSSAVQMVALRTGAALVSAFLLNLILPAEPAASAVARVPVSLSLKETAINWMVSTSILLVKMGTIIFSLNVLQKVMVEFGIIRVLSKLFRPVLKIFGLPAGTSFLWIVANTLGLAYGAAVMTEETEQGKISKKDADLLNYHIAISHSNLEDVLLFFSVGANLWCMLLTRWALAAGVVWIRRFFRRCA